MESKRNNSLFSEIGSLLRTNVRSYTMYVAFAVIVIFFAIQTNGAFLRAANISNLFNQAAYVAVLAIGMTGILIICNIDLSVGFLAGFSGAIVAILINKLSLNIWLSILLALLVGLAFGFYQGVLVVYAKIPSFVITLAGQFILRGLLMEVLSGGTENIRDGVFNAICNSYLPDIFGGEGLNYLTILLGGIGVAGILFSSIKSRRQKQKYHFAVVSTPLYILGLLCASAAVMVITFVLADYAGVPISFCIVIVLLLAYNFVLNKTKLGRAIYAIGGNKEAALLSGINVNRVVMFCFCLMGTLAALAGILYTSRLKSASAGTGSGFELDAIASCYIGGVAVSGGVGKVTNSMIGVMIIISLTNGLNLMSISSSWQYVIKGLIFIIAVTFDGLTNKIAKK